MRRFRVIMSLILFRFSYHNHCNNRSVLVVSRAVKWQIRFPRFSEIKLQKTSLDKPHTEDKSYWKEEMRSNFVKKNFGRE